MWPTVGEVCKFVFVENFTLLDGVYMVLSINTLDELIDQDVDLVEYTWAKVELTQEDYDIAVEELREDNFYKLSNVETEDIIYMPLLYMAEMPDPNIQRYLKLGFGVNIGIFADQDKIDWIKDQIAQVLLSIGVEEETYLFEIEPVWLTEDEYVAIEEARAASTSGELTHYYDKEKLIEENTRLKTIVTAYENTYKTLFGSP